MLFDQLVINEKVYWSAEEIKKFYEPQRDEITVLRDALMEAQEEIKKLRYKISDIKEIVSEEELCTCTCWSCRIA